MFPFAKPQTGPEAAPSHETELIIQTLSSNFLKNFKEDEIVLLSPGSSAATNDPSIFSDIDILGVVNKVDYANLDLKALRRMTSSLKATALQLGKEEIYLGIFYRQLMESATEGLVRAAVAAKKPDAGSINVKLIQALAYPNINSFILFNNYNLRDSLLKGRAIIAKESAKDNLLKHHKDASNPQFDPGKLAKSNVIVENSILHSYILFKSNPYISYEVLAKDSVRNLKSALVATGEKFLMRNYQLNIRQFSMMMGHMDKFPQTSQVAFNEMNKIRERNEVPGEASIEALYNKCVDAINEISVMWL